MHHLLLKYLISFGIGAAMIWLAFRGEDFTGFGDRLRAVNLTPLLGYAVLFAAAHVLRIVRWGVLVRALGPIKWGDIFTAGCVGYMCISVFPLRLGEFVRPYLVRGRGGVTASGALATVVVERVIDGLLFVGLFFAFLSILPPSGNPAVDAVKITAFVAGAVFLTALVVLIAAYTRRAWTVSLLSRIGERVLPSLTHKLLALLEAFLDGLKVLPDKRRIAWFFGMTLVYWVGLGIGMRWMALATQIPDLSYPGGFALLAVLTVGIMVPAGPGFTGTFELALKGGFALLVLAPESLENVALYTIMLHVVQLGVQVGAGALVLASGRVSLGQVVAAGDEAAV